MKEKEKKYKWMVASNIRELVNKMNEFSIKKSNIVSLLYNEQYILVYTE